jgi:hypothetical protein
MAVILSKLLNNASSVRRHSQIGLLQLHGKQRARKAAMQETHDCLT